MRLTRYRFGEFELDPASRELHRAGVLVTLPLKSLECLSYLVAHRERAVGRDELVSAVWGRTDVSDTVITQTMRRARKALDDAGNRQTIVRTIPGFGYRWVAAVEEVEVRAVEVRAVEVRATDAQVSGPGAARPMSVDADTVQAGAPSDAFSANARTNGAGQPPPPGVSSRRRWGWAATALVVAIATVVFAGWLYRSGYIDVATQPNSAGNVVTVLPVSVEPPNAEYSWVRLGAMEYAGERLRGAALKVTPIEQTLHLSAALDRQASSNTAGVPDEAALRDILASSGARWVLVPIAQQTRGQWRVQLRALDGRSELRVEAQGDTPLRAMAVATDAWLRRIGRTSPANAGPTPLQERLQRIDAELDAGQLQTAREQIMSAPVAERADPQMLVREGQLEYRAGRIDEAKALFERALSPNGKSDVETRAKGLMGLGSVALREGRVDEAEQHYGLALATLGDADGKSQRTGLLGNAYNGRGVARLKSGDLDGAVSDLGSARMAMRQDGDVVSAAMVGSNLGRLEARRNHWPQAIQEYDSAIQVFERYQIRDYLAATLGAKAMAQIALVQPAQALQTIARADGLTASIEDATLLGVLAVTRTRALLANGKLDAAAQALRNVPQPSDGDGTWARLAMSLALARGDRAGAAALAAQSRSPSDTTDESVVAVAVQAAGSVEVARAWARLLPVAPVYGDATPAFVDAVIERRFGSRKAALAAAAKATSAANQDGSPEERVRANVLRALVLMDAGMSQEATALSGELDSYADLDYRVAWLAFQIFAHGSDAAATERARLQAQALRGQRSLDVEPLL